MTGGRWAAVLVLLCAAVDGAAESLIRRENAKAGTIAWRLADIAREGEIEGYASKVSIERGESIAFYVSTTDTKYRLEVFRMGWYGGSGARRVHGPVERTGLRQPVPQPQPVTGLIECDWSDPYVLFTVASPDPTEWMSGVYVVKLTASNTKKESLIHFVIREDRRSSDLLFQCAVTRYQAYNNWGGKSLYDFNSSGSEAARKVSFDRPYTFRSGPFEFILSWEYNMVRFLEREGYDVTFATSVETHAFPDMLLTRRAFLSVGHDEYWTWQMRRNVEAARDAGVDLGFFSANTCYWQMRFEASPRTGEPHRVMVSYKERALSEDPLAPGWESVERPSRNYEVSGRAGQRARGRDDGSDVHGQSRRRRCRRREGRSLGVCRHGVAPRRSPSRAPGPTRWIGCGGTLRATRCVWLVRRT